MGGLRRWYGRPRRRTRLLRGTRGYILLDALVAMAIALIGLAAFMGSLSALGRITLRQAARVHTIVDQRNADEQGRAVIFQGR